MVNTLFVLAHPDDETMVGYALAQAVDSGERVRVVVASNGNQSTVNHTDDPDFIRQGKRQSESEQSLLSYGVALEQQIYLDLPDDELVDRLHEMRAAIEAICVQHEVSRIVTLGAKGFDGHADHAATHECAEQVAITRGIELWALNPSQAGERQIAATPELRARKLAGMAMHRSQFPVRRSTADGLGDVVQIDDFYIEKTWWEQDFMAYHRVILEAETFDVFTPAVRE